MKNVVIIKRSGITNGTFMTYIVLIVIGIAGLIYGIIDVTMLHNMQSIPAIICFFAACGIISLYILNMLIQALLNKKVNIDPVTFNQESRKIILTTYNGKSIEVTRAQIIKVGGLSAFDNRLFLTYKIDNLEKKVNLGFIDKNTDVKAEFEKIEKI